MLGTQLLLLLSGSVSRQSNQAVGEKALPSLRASSIMQKFLGREDWKDTQALGGFVYQLPGLCESGALAQGHHAQWPRLHTAQLHRSRGDAIWQRSLDDTGVGWGREQMPEDLLPQQNTTQRDFFMSVFIICSPCSWFTSAGPSST